jgi:hypothetical protein
MTRINRCLMTVLVRAVFTLVGPALWAVAITFSLRDIPDLAHLARNAQ